MKNQDLQGISVARNVVSYGVYHNHEEDDTTYYTNDAWQVRVNNSKITSLVATSQYATCCGHNNNNYSVRTTKPKPVDVLVQRKILDKSLLNSKLLNSRYDFQFETKCEVWDETAYSSKTLIRIYYTPPEVTTQNTVSCTQPLCSLFTDTNIFP
jgi:hypothetical protein